MNFIITIRYEIPTFLEEGVEGPENFGQNLKLLGFFQLRWPLKIAPASSMVSLNMKSFAFVDTLNFISKF